MRKIKKRAFLCLCIATFLVAGLGFFIYEYVCDGKTWVTYGANQHIYANGNLKTGTIYDCHGKLLAKNTKNGIEYNEDAGIRKATVHTVGDKNRSIAASAETAFRDKLVGYNLLTGVYSAKDRKMRLTIDADICRTANEALAGRYGTVGVYNYKTGDIVCLVSSPNFDPEYPPQVASDDTSGLYMNRFLSSIVVPGSIFKLVTTAAVIENLSNMDDWSYTCKGTEYYGPDKITCPSVHGTQDFYGALANSCNCAYAQLAQDIGAKKLGEYVSAFGLNESVDVDGIETTKGSFKFPDDASVNLSWAGIGQYEDLINPCSYLRFVGAVAGGGEAAEPKLIKSMTNSLGMKHKSKTEKTGELINSDTAAELTEMMKNNVEKTYGESNFPGLDIYAKSGTAEIGEGKVPHSWFTGFIKNKPYAFIVLVENGGSGSRVAGSVANQVLQALVNK